jgi:hypothetical protein
LAKAKKGCTHYPLAEANGKEYLLVLIGTYSIYIQNLVQYSAEANGNEYRLCLFGPILFISKILCNIRPKPTVMNIVWLIQTYSIYIQNLVQYSAEANGNEYSLVLIVPILFIFKILCNVRPKPTVMNIVCAYSDLFYLYPKSYAMFG